MDLPRLMIASAEETDLLQSQIVNARFSDKDIKNKELLNVWMNLDLDEGCIRFNPFAYECNRSEQEFYYLGNNKAAAQQVFAVREAAGLINFWTGRMAGILSNITHWSMLGDGELKALLTKAEENNLFSSEGINFSKMIGISQTITVSREDKKLIVDGEIIAAEKWLADYMGISSKQKLMLIIPRIINDGKRIVISNHPDYVAALRTFIGGNDAGESSGKGKKANKGAVCHLCGKRSAEIDTVAFAKKLDRQSISKIFVTTPINYASDFKQTNHQKNFAICRECYEKWHGAEKAVMHDYKTRIGEADAIILTEGILDPLDREDISKINHKVDSAFRTDKLRDWLTELKEDYLDDQNIDLYEFNLLFYQTDGKSCSIYKTIEDVQGIWFEEVMRSFDKVRTNPYMENVLPYFNLGSLYRMIPGRIYGKDKKRDIHELLTLYSNILCRQHIEKSKIYELYAEAIDKGVREICAADIHNYDNLHNLSAYHDRVKSNDIRGLEWYIQYMSLAYQALMTALENLELIAARRELNSMAEKTRYDCIEEKEAFLNQYAYSERAKGLFYVGAMMYQIGQMQYHQGHKNKPILEKVTYSGMSNRDVMELLTELHDKIRQYRKAMEAKQKGYLVFQAELYSEMAYQYLGNLPMMKDSDEHETLFYLMSGYSSCISVTKIKEEEENDQE